MEETTLQTFSNTIFEQMELNHKLNVFTPQNRMAWLNEKPAVVGNQQSSIVTNEFFENILRYFLYN